MTQEQKDEELYKASLEAFFNNELEADKTILGLSVAAIGFYMALFLNKDLQITEVMFITIIISLFSFLIVSSMIMTIFILNKKQLLHIVETTGGFEENNLLTFLDKWKYAPFILGILCSIIFTLSLVFEKININEVRMSKDKPIRESSTIDRIISKADDRNHTASVGGIVRANTNTKQPDKKQENDKSGDKNGK